MKNTISVNSQRGENMKIFKGYLFASLAFGLTLSVWAIEFDTPAYIRGVTDKDPLAYAPGEKMAFTLQLADLGQPIPKGSRIFWRRTGDDGQTVTGSVAAVEAPVIVTTSLAKPGFVRLRAELTDANGKRYERKGGDDFGESRGVYFDGGAAVKPYDIESYPEPMDFDVFWTKRKERLAALPLKADVVEIPVESNTVARLFQVTVNCAGPRPMTAYMTIPRRAFTEGKKYPVTLMFEGYYAALGHPKPPKVGGGVWNGIYVNVNAHGYELGREKEYYQEFRASIESNGHSYGFDPIQNAKTESSYFSGWTYRIMRAVQYARTIPQWDGKSIKASGGSQGGMQAVWAATLGEGVTALSVSVPWSCDLARTEVGRNHGPWYVKWSPALGYFDPVNLIKRMPKDCLFSIGRAGLGDYICPPSGVALLYKNAAAEKKSIHWVQGSTHAYVPPKPHQVHDDKEGCE